MAVDFDFLEDPRQLQAIDDNLVVLMASRDPTWSSGRGEVKGVRAVDRQGNQGIRRPFDLEQPVKRSPSPYARRGIVDHPEFAPSRAQPRPVIPLARQPAGWWSPTWRKS